VSTSFSLVEGESINVNMELFTNLPPSLGGNTSLSTAYGFALLLKNSVMMANLYTIRPNGLDYTYDEFGRQPSTTFAAPSPGVTVATSKGGPVDVTLGGFYYGPHTPPTPADCLQSCSTEITSSYTPGAGTYELLFGTFGPTSSTYRESLAVQSVSVPEPTSDSWLTMAIGFIAIAVLSHRTYAARLVHGGSVFRAPEN
jgi:hypothetical protein